MRNCVVVVGIFLLGGAVIGMSGCSSKTCATSACQDGFTAKVRRTDGSFPNGTHRIEVLVGAASSSCTFTFPLETSPSGGAVLPTCPTGLAVSVGPAEICTETVTGTGVSYRCDPIPGQFVETISLSGTPGQIHVWQYVDDVPILDAAAAPSYEEARPNGPECEPVCRQASVSWTLQ